MTDAGSRGSTASGDEVANLYRPLVVAPHADGRRRTQHHITNVSVDVDDDLSAVCRASYLLVKQVEGTLTVEASGRYGTRLSMGPSGWAVHEHRVIRDMARTP